uniref:Uncharacterized protein n=1 Tax=Fagus sylvatica TaxID=28930 RepID=A0A2N9J3X3_FAGSY
MVAFSTSPALVSSFPSFPFSADVAVDVFVKVSTATIGQYEEPAFFGDYEAWRSVFLLGKVLPLFTSSSAPKKKGEEKGGIT